MNRSLSALALLILIASGVQAQRLDRTTEYTFEAPSLPLVGLRYAEPVMALVGDGSEYLWFSRIYRNDGARFDPYIPYRLRPRPGRTDTAEWRGVGQLFAPHVLYSFYSGSVYNQTSNIYYKAIDPGDQTDQDYINQFDNAGDYTIDSLQLFVYQNHKSTPVHGGKIEIYRSMVDLNGAEYRTEGFDELRGELPQAYSHILTPADLDSASASSSDSIFATRLRFAPSDSMRFENGESAVVMYINDDAPAVGPDNVPEDADVQFLLAQLEWKDGSRGVPGGVPDTRSNPLTDYKSFGLVMYRDTAKLDHILSGFTRLTFEGKPGIFDLNMVFWGTVSLSSGVTYHFGYDASSQGIGAAWPNPARQSTRIPFSLVEHSHVTIDLYNSNGELIRRLVDASYIEGNYSYDLPLGDLPGGNYMVRMSAGGASYSGKIGVVR